MEKIKVFIVEDEPLIADDLRYMLEDMGYNILDIQHNYNRAIESLSTRKYDLAILDIQLGDNKTGIDLAIYINEYIHIPFIFLTSYSDKATVEKAKLTNPIAYMVKPIDENDVLTTIEIAMFNYNQQINKEDNAHFFVKDKLGYIKLDLKTILYVEASDNYSIIHTKKRKHLLSMTLKSIEERLKDYDFLRIHRSYIVNTKFITRLEETQLGINNQSIPISRKYRKLLRDKIQFM